jgi:hypothetical protein
LVSGILARTGPSPRTAVAMLGASTEKGIR